MRLSKQFFNFAKLKPKSSCNGIVELIEYLRPLSYGDQLKWKVNEIEKNWRNLSTTLLWDEHLPSRTRKYLLENYLLYTHSPTLIGVISEEELDSYRTQDTFLCGRNDDNEIQVGYYLKRGEKQPLIVEADDLCTIRQKHLKIGKLFKNFLETATSFRMEKGEKETMKNWKNVFHRINVKSNDDESDCLLSIHACLRHLTEKEKELLKFELKDYFNGNDLISSLVLINSPNDNIFWDTRIEKIIGNGFFVEKYDNYQIRQSSFSTPKVHRNQLIKMMKQIKNHLDGSFNDSVLIDVCCDSGLSSIFLSDNFLQVFAIDPTKWLIDDMLYNIERNNIGNISAIFGKSYPRLKGLLYKLTKEKETDAMKFKDITLLIHVDYTKITSDVRKIVRLARLNDNVKNVIYISQNIGGPALHNIYEMTAGNNRGEKLFGKPFFPIDQIFVDLIPQTTVVGSVIFLKKLENDFHPPDTRIWEFHNEIFENMKNS
ncbi:hypothetical protein SNEBB_000328 [Seison nebaliae]|nr:hypothetical protein SNEBB_000328 [Seison nebaliae]